METLHDLAATHGWQATSPTREDLPVVYYQRGDHSLHVWSWGAGNFWCAYLYRDCTTVASTYDDGVAKGWIVSHGTAEGVAA